MILSEKFTDLSQPTMSHHFKILADAEILVVEKNGTEKSYSLNTKNLKKNGRNFHLNRNIIPL